jgi:2-phosphoglycerate kinase
VLYLIGGPTRTGKSALGLAMLRAHGIPWMATDVVRHMLRSTVPEIDAIERGEGSMEDRVRVMRPFVGQLIELCLGQAPDFLVEGVEIVPDDVAGYSDRFGETRACFVGDPRASTASLRAYRGVNPWHQTHTDAELEAFAAPIRAWSAHVEDRCRELGLGYIDVGRSSFDEMIERGLEILAPEP